MTRPPADRVTALDLGCGTAKVEGALGLDVVPLKGVDVVGDLMQRPYPFADDSFDTVHLHDVIEHIPDTIKTMEEVYRILRPDGRAYVRVVNWNSTYTAMDPTHVNAYTENSFDFFGKRAFRSYYTQARFDVVRVERGYNSRARLFFPSERLLYFLSHYLSNVLEDLNFELRAVKPGARGSGDKGVGWLELLRCPRALAQGLSGRLSLAHGCWLVCAETSHKYPVCDGVPVLSRAEGARWAETAVADLPVPPPPLRITPVDQAPLETTGADGLGFRPIATPGDLAVEVVKTYSAALARAPFRLLGKVARRLARSWSR